MFCQGSPLVQDHQPLLLIQVGLLRHDATRLQAARGRGGVEPSLIPWCNAMGLQRMVWGVPWCNGTRGGELGGVVSYTMMKWDWTSLPVNKMTDTTEILTFPQTTYAARLTVSNHFVIFSSSWDSDRLTLRTFLLGVFSTGGVRLVFRRGRQKHH